MIVFIHRSKNQVKDGMKVAWEVQKKVLMKTKYTKFFQDKVNNTIIHHWQYMAINYAFDVTYFYIYNHLQHCNFVCICFFVKKFPFAQGFVFTHLF